ncbi:MAG: hypothetical protein P1V20_03785 [Verrucomicrobiales bacterium]|nr:hypothetical protein [Verrucomicrobiales bacterium]
MKLYTLILITLLAGSSLSYGRLYESELELSQRFGPPVSRATSGNYGSRLLNYRKDKWSIRAWLVNDQCQQISYSFLGGARPTSDQINALVNSNSDGHTWSVNRGKISAVNILLPSIATSYYVRSDEEAYCQTTTFGATFKTATWLSSEERVRQQKVASQREIPRF